MKTTKKTRNARSLWIGQGMLHFDLFLMVSNLLLLLRVLPDLLLLQFAVYCCSLFLDITKQCTGTQEKQRKRRKEKQERQSSVRNLVTKCFEIQGNAIKIKKNKKSSTMGRGVGGG